MEVESSMCPADNIKENQNRILLKYWYLIVIIVYYLLYLVAS